MTNEVKNTMTNEGKNTMTNEVKVDQLRKALLVISQMTDEQCSWNDAGIRARDLAKRALAGVDAHPVENEQPFTMNTPTIRMYINILFRIPDGVDRAAWLHQHSPLDCCGGGVTCACPTTKQVTLVIKEVKDIPLVDVPCACGSATCWAIKWGVSNV